jgi:hypothetical protein
MDNRVLASVFFIAVALAIGVLEDASAQNSGTLMHPGRVLDRFAKDPVVASVTAWANSERTDKDGSCDQFGEAPIDAKTSASKDGRFKLGIQSSYPTFTVVYCASGYHSRTDRFQSNTTNGTSLDPLPAELWPVQTQEAMYSNEVRRTAIVALNELAYLRSVNSDEFETVMGELIPVVAETSKAQADALSQFTNAVAAWGQ